MPTPHEQILSALRELRSITPEKSIRYCFETIALSIKLLETAVPVGGQAPEPAVPEPALSPDEDYLPLSPVARSTVAVVVAHVRTEKVRKQRDEEGAMAQVVFAYWQDVMGTQRAVFDTQRRARIVARLRESRGDLGELLYVVDGAERDDWTMGRSGRSATKYNGVETIFRDRAMVERLAGTQRGYQQQQVHPVLAAMSAVGVVA